MVGAIRWLELQDLEAGNNMDQEIEEKLVKNATALIEEFEKRYIIAIRSKEGVALL